MSGRAAEAAAACALAALMALLGAWAHVLETDMAHAERATETFAVHPSDRTNTAAQERMRRADEKRWTAQRVEQLALMRAADAPQEPQDGAWGAVYVESGYGAGDAGSAPQGPSDGLTRNGGVNHHEGRKETWYSSNVLRHHRTDEWAPDDEGFYRTPEGYYVVAASDMPEGTVFAGSKGDCIVADTGCPEGVTDYYVNF